MENMNWEDDLPEGLEFKEEYMAQAFEMYDAEKKKRKKRLFIWFFTSVLAATFVAAGTIAWMQTHKSRPALAQQRGDRSAQTVSAQRPASSQDKPTLDASVHAASGGDTLVAGQKTARSEMRRKRRENPDGVGHILPNDTLRQLETTQRRERVDALPFFSGYTVENPLDKTHIIQQLVAKADSSRGTSETSGVTYHALLGTNTLFGIEAQRGQFKLQEALGVEVVVPLRHQWQFSFQTEYFGISQVDYRQYIGANDTEDPSRTYFTKTALSYLSVIPKIAYRRNRHAFSVGLGGEFLLPFSSTKFGAREFTSAEVATNGTDLYDAFKRVNAHAQLGYSFAVTPYFQVHAAYVFGFTDVTVNSPINTAFDRNSRLHLGIKLKLNHAWTQDSFRFSDRSSK